MAGLTREQRRAKNRKILDDQVKNSNIYQHFQFDNTVMMVEEIEQELITLLPKKANPKIKNWGYNAVRYGGCYTFLLQIHVLRPINHRPYIVLRQIEMHGSMQNKGYGTTILKSLIEKSQTYGYDGVEIECICSPAMEHIATKLGFERIGDTKDFILRTKED